MICITHERLGQAPFKKRYLRTHTVVIQFSDGYCT